jgi:hypothetical protein
LLLSTVLGTSTGYCKSSKTSQQEHHSAVCVQDLPVSCMPWCFSPRRVAHAMLVTRDVTIEDGIRMGYAAEHKTVQMSLLVPVPVSVLISWQCFPESRVCTVCTSANAPPDQRRTPRKTLFAAAWSLGQKYPRRNLTDAQLTKFHLNNQFIRNQY